MNQKTAKEQTTRDLIVNFLKLHGEDPQREGLIETPSRVARMYEELLCGYSQDPKSHFKTFPSNGYNELIVIKDIDFYSLCEHHMIPFFGKVHIGYIPNGRILGLSKFARLVDVFSRRLQTQENLTKQILDAINDNLKPKGSVIQIEAEHLCVSMRGIKKKGFITKTIIPSGLLKENNRFLEQFNRDVRSD